MFSGVCFQSFGKSVVTIPTTLASVLQRATIWTVIWTVIWPIWSILRVTENHFPVSDQKGTKTDQKRTKKENK